MHFLKIKNKKIEEHGVWNRFFYEFTFDIYELDFCKYILNFPFFVQFSFMWKQFVVSQVMRLIIIIGLLCVTMSGSALKTLPCHFLDSINITGGFLRPDESIMFDGIVYPRTKYAPMNYILKDGTDKIAIDPHIRGCICEIESCLRLCCPLGTHWIKQNRTGACEVHEGARNSEGNILHENKETEKIFIDNHFAYVHGKPCKLLHFDEDYRITHVRISIFINRNRSV